MSRSTVAPPTFFQRNRRFQIQLPVVSSEIRCPLTPRRHRSIGLCTQEIWILLASIVSFLASSSYETFVQENRWFGGGGIVVRISRVCFGVFGRPVASSQSSD